MAKYIKQEIPDLHKDGNNKSYYRLKREGNISTRKLVKNICKHAGVGLSEGILYHALQEIASELVYQLADGYTVTLDGIGTFRATIGLKQNKEMDEIDGDSPKHNATSLELKGVKFTVDKELVKRARIACKLERGGISRVNRSPYTKEERLKMAQDYLSKPDTPCMSVSDYSELTKLPKSSAAKELNAFLHTPNTHLMRIGHKTHIVYALHKKQEE